MAPSPESTAAPRSLRAPSPPGNRAATGGADIATPRAGETTPIAPRLLSRAGGCGGGHRPRRIRPQPRLPPPGSIHLFLPLILLIPALIALARRFDGLYGQDPFAYHDYAVGPLRASLLAAAPPPPFRWPPGYPLLVALASFVVGVRPLAGQLVSLLAAASVPPLATLLAREVSQPRPSAGPGDMSFRRVPVPLLAGLLVACCPQLWQSAIVVMSDTAGLAAATAGVYALVRYGRERRGRWLGLAAALIACAIVTRWAYALVALPCAAYAGWLFAQTAPDERRRALRHAAVAAVLPCLLLGALLVAAVPADAPYAPFAVDLQVYRWRPLNMLSRDFATADGRLSYPLPNGLYYATLLARPLYFTPLLAPPLLLGLWRVSRRPTPPALLLVGWLASILAFHAGAPWQNVRFALAAAPPCAILIALGLAAIAERASRPRALAANALLALSLVWMLITGALLLDNFIDRKEADLVIARALDAPDDTRILTFGLTLTLQHYAPYDTRDLSTLDPATLAALLADGRPTLLLLDVPNIEQQWRDRPLAANYRWLRDNQGLIPITRHGPYTLYRVAPRATLAPRPIPLVTRYSLLVSRRSP